MAEDSKSVHDDVEPHLARHGKVAYIEIPARDPITSAVFYEAVFGWTLSPTVGERVTHTLGPSENARVPFRDVPSGLIGAFVAARGASPDGLVLHIYVEDLESVLDEIEARGCEILERMHPEGGINLAQFRDPGGNVVGIWEGAAS